VTDELVVVTGGAGFLGSHLVPALLPSYRVRVVDVADPPSWVESVGADYRVGDVGDVASVESAVEGADIVVHAAFAPPTAASDRLAAVNVGGARAVRRAAARAGARQVVLVSSTIVTARPRRHPFLRSAPVNRLDAYRATRAAAEQEALRATGAGPAVAVVRPKTFIGPGRVGGFALVFDLVRSGRSVPIAGPGTNRYQLLDVRDLAAGLRLLVDRGGAGIYELGACEYGTIADDLESLARAAGTGARIRPLPGPLGRVLVRGVELAGMAPLAEWHHCAAAGRDSVVDTERARSELGWVPTRSNVEALVEAYRWYSGELDRGTGAATTHPVPGSHRRLGRVAGSVLR